MSCIFCGKYVGFATRHLCPRCHLLSVEVGSDKYSLEVLVARFIAFHTRSWERNIIDSDFGIALESDDRGKFHLRVCKHETQLYEFLVNFWKQFSLSTIVEDRNPVPIWYNTTDDDWYEGAELFYDWFDQYKHTERPLSGLNLDEDVVRTAVAAIFKKFWNEKFGEYREYVIEHQFSSPDEDKRKHVVDILASRGQILPEQVNLWKKFLSDHTTEDERSAIKREILLTNYEWSTPFELIQRVVENLVSSGKIRSENAQSVTERLYARWQEGELQLA